MSFRGEMKDFVEGWKVGQDTLNDASKRRFQEASTDKISGPTEEQLANQETAYTPGGGGKISQSQGGTDPGTTKSTGKVDNDTNQIAGRLKGDLMRDFKISDIAAGGIVSSLAAESGGFKTLQEINPTVKGSRGGYGYAQWTGPRRDQFEAYAKDKGLDINSYEANYGFLKQELEGPEGGILKDLANAKDYREATQIFTGSAKEGRGFLRPGTPNMEGRFAWADKIGGVKAGEGPAGTDVASSGKGVSTTPEVEQPGEGEQRSADASDSSYSPDTGIPVPEIKLSEVSDPAEIMQLNQQQIAAGPPSPPVDQQALPALFAAEGGAIPEPQYLAAGGSPIDYTQAPPPTAAAPVTIAPKPAPVGPTASQLAFRAANKPVAPKPVAPKPVAPVQPRATPIIYGAQQFGGGYGTGGSQQSSVWRMDPATGKRVQMPKGAHFMDMSKLQPGTTPPRGAVGPGLFAYDEGGMIPEPGEQPVQMFARGGAVEDDGYFTKAKPAGDRDARFQQLLREESRGSGAGGRSGSARDRAAKRLSAEEGRPTSSAYTPGRKKLPPGKGGKIKEKAPDKTETKSTDKPEIADPHTNVVPSPTPEIADPHTNVKPSPQIADPHTNVVPSLTPEIADPHTNVAPVIPEPNPNPDPNRPPPPAPGTPGPSTPGWELDPRPMPPPEPAPPPQVSPAPDSILGNIAGALPEAPPDSFLGSVQAAQPTTPNLVRPEPAPNPVPPVPSGFVPPQPSTGPDHATALANAQKALAAGEDPKIVGQGLIDQGIPMELWPIEMQNSFLGFAEGGMIPEPGQRGFNEAVASGGTATQQAAPEPEAPEREKRQATPKLLSHVGQAIDGGIKFLSREFGLTPQGAVPSPDDDATHSAGAQRMANGEGAATPEEINEVDNAIDPDRQLNEGDRQMTRLAKTVQWYLEHGRKDDAEAAAASLMMYGSKRFGRLGVAAEGAYQAYLQDGDPKNLQNTTDYLEAAYQMIPDGADINITIDPQTKRLQAQRTGADGKVENYDIGADEIPGLLKSVQDGSMYWNQISRLGDPEGTKLRETHAYDTAKEKEKRTYEEGQDVVKRQRDEEAKIATEKRTAEQEEIRSKRDKAEAERVRLETEAFQRSRPDKDTKPKADMTVVGPAFAAASAAKKAMEEDDSEANITTFNEAMSRLLDATGGDQTWVQAANLGEFDYVTPADPNAAAEPKLAPDGKYYVPDPARPGKFLEVEPPAAAQAAE